MQKDLVGAEAGDRGIRGQLLLVGVDQPQLGCDGAQRLLDAVPGGELVRGPVQVQAFAPGRIPRPAQEHGPGGGVVGGGPQRDGGAVLGAADCDADWRHVGLAVRQHVGYPVEHRAHHVGRINQ